MSWEIQCLPVDLFFQDWQFAPPVGVYEFSQGSHQTIDCCIVSIFREHLSYFLGNTVSVNLKLFEKSSYIVYIDTLTGHLKLAVWIAAKF